jgi:hypothetical protein
VDASLVLQAVQNVVVQGTDRQIAAHG